MHHTDLFPYIVHLLAVAFIGWVVVQWVRSIVPDVLTPKPSTPKSRLATRLISLAVCAVIGALRWTPTILDGSRLESVAAGALAGVLASVLHLFFSRALKAGERRALAKIAGNSPGETPKEAPDA